MKKVVLGGLAAFAVSALLAGCSGGAPASTEKITLNFQSLAFADTTIAATQEIVDDWNADNPDVQVNLVQGSWDSVHDQLVTQFQGGTAPDIIHDESADIAGFAEQGYLADLSPYLDKSVKDGISQEIWDSVTSSDGKIVAAPTLLQTYVVFANTDALAAAGVSAPDGDTMTWDELRSMAQELTTGDQFGLGWGLKSPTATVMNLSIGFGGEFFNADGTAIDVGSAELEVPKRIHQMAYDDGSLDPVSLTQSGGDVLPGFYGGKYALYVGGNYIAQQLTESAPDGFNWEVLPPLAGTVSAAQAANPQTLSVAAESKHVKEAAEFINFYMSGDNLSKVALGDWLIPSANAAREAILASTGGADGWAQAIASGKALTKAPFQSATNYPQWKDQIATPALQQYLADAISLDELQKQLTDGWASVNG